jgi:RNA polymerase sigma-70 factor (ECF subfamily)
LVKLDKTVKSSDISSETAIRSRRLEELVRRHASAVRGVCLAYTRNLHDAEDIMQDVFMKALTKLDSLRDPGRMRPWLFQIARRMCTDYYRRKRPTQPLSQEFPAKSKSGFAFPMEKLHAAIAKLPTEDREAILLFYLDGRKCSHIAESLGISETAVRKRLVRARLKLHEILAEDPS